MRKPSRGGAGRGVRVLCALLPRVPTGAPPASVPVPLPAGTTGEENVPRGLLETCNFIGCPCCMTNPTTRAMERSGLNCEGLMPASTSPALGAGPPPPSSLGPLGLSPCAQCHAQRLTGHRCWGCVTNGAATRLRPQPPREPARSCKGTSTHWKTRIPSPKP